MSAPKNVFFSSRGIRVAEVRDWPLRALRKTRQEISYRSPPVSLGDKPERETSYSRCVAAIDFGTTNCSLAYSIDDRGDQIVRLNEYYTRVPTAIMLKRGQANDGGTECSIHSFGEFAQKQYHENNKLQKDPYLFFERMKLNLQHDQEVCLKMVVKAVNDNSEWFLVEVIAFIFLYLKQQLEKHLKMQKVAILSGDGQNRSIEITDFEWVITVPAIWQTRGKRMITEAGNLAGLSNIEDGITCLSHTDSGLIHIAAETSPKISVVPEPEAAGLHCMNITQDDMADFCSERSIHDRENRYIVIDIGGGTTDIAVLEVDRHLGSVDLLQPPEGSNSGGINVNHAFARFMQKILGESETASVTDLKSAFPNLLAGENCLRLQRSLNKLIYGEFEGQKQIFGDTCLPNDDKCDEMEIQIHIPHEIVENCGSDMIHKSVKELADPRVEYEDSFLHIKYPKVKEFFCIPWNVIEKCLHTCICRNSSKNIDVIYLVGGFGGNRYIYNLMKSSLENHFKDRKMKLLVPKRAEMSVTLGAVKHRMGQLIRSRYMNLSYGIVVTVKLTPCLKYNIECNGFDEDGDKVCSDAFLTFINKGDRIDCNEVVVDCIYPDIDDQKHVLIPFYCSDEKNLEYLHDRSHSDALVPLARKVGEIKFEIPQGDILHKDQRRFQIIMDFSSPEIVGSVRYQNTKINVHTTLSFLS